VAGCRALVAPGAGSLDLGDRATRRGSADRDVVRQEPQLRRRPVGPELRFVATRREVHVVTRQDLCQGLARGKKRVRPDTVDAHRYPSERADVREVEALRHHVLPHLYVSLEDLEQERLEHAGLDRTTVMSIPTAEATPFGEVEAGAPHLLHYEPAWTCAREAARHARAAARDRQGEAGERSTRNWQAQQLEALLSPAESRSVVKNQDDAR